MKVESTVALGRGLTTLFAVAASLGIVALLGFGYRATREWQRSSEQLIVIDTAEVADLLLTAVTRDMRSVQSRVLANRDWAESAVSSADTSVQVAIAFTRYPYPESFFSWRSRDSAIVFYNRVNRYPAWMPDGHPSSRLPVAVVTDPSGAEALRHRIDSFGAARYRYVVFDTDLGGQPYQIVARLTYTDPLQEEPYSVVGFTVNLDWVRRSYFADILSQVAPLIARGSSLEIGVLDDAGRLVWGTDRGTPEMVREFPFLFLDPSFGKVAIASHPAIKTWKIRASQAESSPLLAASQDADEALLMAGAAAFALCLGLVLTIRAVYTGVALATMRSEFVSSVTHELKMPLANIRVMADTLALRPVAANEIQNFPGLLKQEAARLTRLIDNLLAYARVTDIADVYHFETLAVPRLIESALQAFRQPLTDRRFTVDVDIPDTVPLIRADRASMTLVLDNLIDNAIRYSADGGRIRITAALRDALVWIEVSDRGTGIPADELLAVRRKFVRGRQAPLGGSGLGLAIVNRIIADHGGHFQLESDYGIGTVARVSLPLAEAES
jgi:signal transduction histidine kinase